MKKIYINPGHSEKDPGAVGYETERKLNVKVSQYMSEYLLANYDCETKVYSADSLSAVCSDANSWGADLFVSNHFNAGKGDGYEALVYNQNRVALGKIYEKYVLAAGQNSRGVKLRPDLYVLSKTHMAAIVNEGAFVDKLTDIQDWNEDAELKKLGQAYAKAAAEFLELKEKAKAPVETSFTVKLRLLRNGDTGKDVQALQILLNGKGEKFNCGNADGIFGSKTENGVRELQRAWGLPVTGVADAETMGRLLGVE